MQSLPSYTDLSKIPIAFNPNGDPPNFTDPPSLAHIVSAVGITLIVISSLVVVVRLATNFQHTGKLELDDYLCLFAEIGGIGYWALIYSLRDSARHMWDIPFSVIDAPFMKREYAVQTIIGPTMWASKAAIIALYIRVFGRVRWLRITSYGLLIFTFLFYWSNIAIFSAFCIPKNGAPWNTTALERCSRSGAAFVSNGVFGVAADIVVFALPLPVILKLQLGRKKTGLCIVFLLGFLEVIASVLSLFYRVRLFLGQDLLWHGNKLATVSFFEVFGTVIVSCAPALFSFWINTVAPSRLYSSLLGSRLFLSRAPPSKDQKGNEKAAKNGPRHHYSSPSPKFNHACKAAGRQPYTEIYSSADEPISTGENVITKSITIKQQSEYEA